MSDGYTYERACDACKGLGASHEHDPEVDAYRFTPCEACGGKGWVSLNGPEMEML